MIKHIKIKRNIDKGTLIEYLLCYEGMGNMRIVNCGILPPLVYNGASDMNISELRKNAGMTQKEFAERYGIPLRTIQKWERNGSTPSEYVVRLVEKNMFLENTELFMETYWKDERTATVRLDREFAYIERFTLNPIKQIFYSDKISRFEFGDILKDRCWDEHRPDIDRILELIGLDEYNPYEICKRTHGRMYQDSIWFRFSGEVLTYEELKYV